MILKVNKSLVTGKVNIPGSKSHTIRALFIASLAKGTSYIKNPLISDDSNSAVKVCSALGAKIKFYQNQYIVQGFNGSPIIPEDVINVGNSGTTLRIGIMTSALNQGYSIFTGDHQIRNRPLGPLIEAMNNLGCEVFSTRDNGKAPIVVKGRAKGGETNLDAITSQYLSSLLINAPLLEQDTKIHVTRLNESPYVDLTMWWLDKQGINYENDGYRDFFIKGGQKYNPFDIVIPGDFSSATFFMVLAAISKSKICIFNLDMTDKQGDKEVLGILKSMGAKVEIGSTCITIQGDNLIGKEIDMNAIPDAVPAMAVAGCFAEGETKLLNVPQARLKETDRLNVMCEELKKMGADIRELSDGLIIKKSRLRGAKVCGHYDHRVVMALAIAGLSIDGETFIDTAEAMNVTYPSFTSDIIECGGNMKILS